RICVARHRKIAARLSSGLAQRLLQSRIGNVRCVRLPPAVGFNDLVDGRKLCFAQFMIAGYDLSPRPAIDHIFRSFITPSDFLDEIWIAQSSPFGACRLSGIDFWSVHFWL